jgi:DNA-binding NtrC family response regulator
VASGHRLLVVDDEVDMCWALENILGKGGIKVRAATKGQEALRLVQKDFYKAVLLDAKLPDLSGLEVAEKIRSVSPESKIIIISGYYYSDDPEIQKGLESGVFSGFLTKPFDLIDVRLIAHQILEGSS